MLPRRAVRLIASAGMLRVATSHHSAFHDKARCKRSDGALGAQRIRGRTTMLET